MDMSPIRILESLVGACDRRSKASASAIEQFFLTFRELKLNSRSSVFREKERHDREFLAHFRARLGIHGIDRCDHHFILVDAIIAVKLMDSIINCNGENNIMRGNVAHYRSHFVEIGG